jgi:ribosomal protein S19
LLIQVEKDQVENLVIQILYFPQFVGCYEQIYNVKSYVDLNIIEKMVGHKFGEFTFT